MSWRVEWPKHEGIQSYGRNRSSFQAGICLKVYDWSEPHRLILKPINGKGLESEGCLMEVPVTSIPELIQALQDIQAHHQRIEAAKAAGVAS